mmetsp:Transcript_16385/g.11530  ORF Transcript_16385/g.11530 Transcript_16385/m.11530 type:complete len:117 (+) Transcript_16385:51-401(+)
MNNIAAYLLCVLGGNATPSASDVTGVITACGGEANEEQLTLFFSEIEGKSIDELFEEGKASISKCSSAVGGGAAAAPAAGGAAAAAAPAAAAKPKEEEVDALEGGMDMFGGGGSDY